MSGRVFFTVVLLFPLSAARGHRWLRNTSSSELKQAIQTSSSSESSYTPAQANANIGSQHWYESGYYADKGLSEHYDGYFCLCTCTPTPEGIFCKGNGVQPSGEKVADFLGVFSESFGGENWEGDLIAYGTDTPFSDKFKLKGPGSGANYTGVSQSLQEER